MDLITYIYSNELYGIVYVIMFFGMFIDANLTILSSIFLFTESHGIFSQAIFLPVILGGFAEQFVLVFIGWHLRSKEKIAVWADRVVGKYDSHLTGNIFRSLLLSKFVLGLHRAVLIRIGMLKLSWQDFLKATLKSTLIWLFIVGFLGFAFSKSYQILAEYFNYAGLLLLTLFLVFVILEILVSRKLKKDI